MYVRIVVFRRDIDNELYKLFFNEHGGLLNVIKNILIENAKESEIIFSGVMLSQGKYTIEDIESSKKFIKKIDKWLLFDSSGNYFLVVNTDDLSNVQIPIHSLASSNEDMVNPMFWYLDKKTLKPYIHSSRIHLRDYHSLIANYVKKHILSDDEVGTKTEIPKEPAPPKTEPKTEPAKQPEKKVKSFWDFLKFRK